MSSIADTILTHIGTLERKIRDEKLCLKLYEPQNFVKQLEIQKCEEALDSIRTHMLNLNATQELIRDSITHIRSA